MLRVTITRDRIRRWASWLWIAATSIGMAAGLTTGAALVDYGISRGDILLMRAVTGLGVRGLQALVLARSEVSGALWWAVAKPACLGTLLARNLVRDHEKMFKTNSPTSARADQ